MSPAQAAGAIETVADLDRINSLGSAELLGLYSIASDAICKRIYARAGVYLLVGVIISFVGLGIFYLRSRDIPTGTSIIEHGLYLLPGFGVLFFVEFVALFFLRQYRSAMDEFRYFESIKRHREETLVALKICSESSAKTSIQHMLKNLNLYSGSPKLARGETTDLLESRKMQKDEIVLFEKALDLMNFVRSERSKSKSTKKKTRQVKKPRGLNNARGHLAISKEMRPCFCRQAERATSRASGRRAAAGCRATRTSAQLAQEAFAILGHWGSNADATDTSASRSDCSSDNRFWMYSRSSSVSLVSSRRR
jgi:hypothetical protein